MGIFLNLALTSIKWWVGTSGNVLSQTKLSPYFFLSWSQQILRSTSLWIVCSVLPLCTYVWSPSVSPLSVSVCICGSGNLVSLAVMLFSELLELTIRHWKKVIPRLYCKTSKAARKVKLFWQILWPISNITASSHSVIKQYRYYLGFCGF